MVPFLKHNQFHVVSRLSRLSSAKCHARSRSIREAAFANESDVMETAGTLSKNAAFNLVPLRGKPTHTSIKTGD